MRENNFFMESADYLIAGGGCAGLSLAYYMTTTPGWEAKKILIVDADAKNRNDRTWCFWAETPGIFAPIVYHSWPKLRFEGKKFQTTASIFPYHYYMIQGIDFYEMMQRHLKKQPQVAFVNAKIKGFEEKDHQIYTETDKGRLESKAVFNSIIDFNFGGKIKGNHYLWQHFKGYFIKTQKPIFKKDTATFMDTSLLSDSPFQFMYVLPFSSNKALVEYTLFSENLLEDATYDAYLKDYLAQKWQLREDNMEILAVEKAKIPMTDHLFPSTSGERLFHIGVASGMAKPSSGYAFKRIQQQTQAIAQNLTLGKAPADIVPKLSKQFLLFDRLLLSILAQNNQEAARVFSSLFQNNAFPKVLDFLDEKTRFFPQNLKIMASVPPLPFLKAIFRQNFTSIGRDYF